MIRSHARALIYIHARRSKHVRAYHSNTLKFTQVIECNAQMSIGIRHCETTVMVIRSLNGKVIANVVDYLEAGITTTLTGCLPMHRLLYGLPQSVIGYSPGDVIMARKTGIKQFLTI